MIYKLSINFVKDKTLRPTEMCILCSEILPVVHGVEFWVDQVFLLTNPNFPVFWQIYCFYNYKVLF